MINTPELNTSFSTGHLTVHEDGDSAVQAEQTTSCPEEAMSIKVDQQVLKKPETENSPGGVFIKGLDTPIDKIKCVTLKHGRMAGSSTLGDQNKARRHQSSSKYEEELRRLNERKKEIWQGINKKQGIKIATLNMKGRNGKNKKSKWPTLVTLMRKQRITILGLQETHLDEDETEITRKMCPKVEILSNGTSKNKEGIAFVINKELANRMTMNHRILIEGRASRLTVKVEEERGLDIILIYAPNEDTEKAKFFEELKEKISQEQDMNNVIIMGDFNSVEHELDRFPHRTDKGNVIEKWKKIKKKMKLVDGWRLHNELRKDYTFIQEKTQSMSRIDRIYLDNEIYPYGYNWNHVSSANISDHDMVTVEILKKKLPYIGKGIWRMHQDDVEDETVKKESKELLTRVRNEMREIKESQRQGIQELWMETKEDIKQIVIRIKKNKRKDLEKNKKKLKRKIAEKLEEIGNEIEELKEKNKEELKKLKQKLAKTTNSELIKIQEATKARYRQKGEKYTKYWFNINKKRADSQVILALQRPNGTLTNKTNEMTTIALNHHRELQKRPEMTKERLEAINIMKKTSETKTTPEEKETLKNKTSYEEIRMSLKKAPNGSSPGIDGIPYEFYKDKMTEHEKNEESPDIVEILHMVIEEIETFGLKKMSKEEGPREKEFTDGLMHLLFKKKEKWKIENYRPITLLNTDYKTYTKTIAMRLAEVAKNMIHEDQAGFIPKRSLYDHTKTTNLVIEYCEMMDKNGCIIALDQEKAYDKIDHEYLWLILENYEFPKEFIMRIKELYKSTEKAIIVNGVITKHYKVQRGVHQGDPMSCLLYNFAIEPLADAIRKSNLKGIKVNEDVKRLIVNLFADDTLIYLSEEDDIKKLKTIIEAFCKASTAKFNMEKTEYLPIGNKEFRKKVIETRKIGKNTIEDNVKIVKDGESMRTLGAWVGNETNTKLQWNTILQKQEEAIIAWSNTNTSLKGKEIILKALIQSKAMFLATVNGMPKDIEEKMKSLFKNFLWDNKKRGLMEWKQVIAPREQGGLGVPDIRARIEAIELMWVKKWLTPQKNKPKWTYIMDEIVNNNIAKSPMIDKESRINWLKQSWHESKAKNVKISKGVTNMLKVARKYNITLEPLKYSKETKNDEPLWHNRLMTEANYQWNKKSSRCLRELHDIETIKDLVEYEPQNICKRKACIKMVERLQGMIPEIINPTKETPQKVRIKQIDLTPKRIKENENNPKENIYNPDITVRGNILEQVRLFDTESGTKTRGRKIKPKKPAYRKTTNETEGKTKAKIIIAIKKEGQREQETKINIIMKGSTKINESFKLKKNEQSEERATATALLLILEKDKTNKLEIVTTDTKLIKWIGKGINEEEDIDWANTKQKDIWKSVLNLLRERNAETRIRIPNKKEEHKMKLAKKSLKNSNPEEIKIKNTKDNKYLQKGARLDKLTQKIAYELILKKSTDPPGGPQTWRRIRAIKNNLKEKWNTRIDDEKVWKDLENIKNTKIRDFIWKMIHNRIKCGKFFKHIPNWQEKQFCRCGQIESIEHILLECKESKQKSLWKVVKRTWKKLTGLKWKKLTIDDILAIGSIKPSKSKDRILTKEVFTTLVTTAIWSIWKNRNNRVFNDKEETKKGQIEMWKRELKREIEIEYELIRQAGIRNRTKETNRFLTKWNNEDLVRIEENDRGKRRIRINL